MTTLLRIKRKRNAAQPLEALVVDEKTAKKQKNGSDQTLFRYADTVAVDFFHSSCRLQDLQKRVALGPEASSSSPISPPSSAVVSHPSSGSTTPLRKRPLVSQRVSNEGAALSSPSVTSQSHPPPSSRSEVHPRFVVVDRIHMDDDTSREEEQHDPRFPTPPVVVSAAALRERKRQAIRIYDAVQEKDARQPKLQGPGDLVQAFIPMLEEYLTLQDAVSHRGPTASVPESFAEDVKMIADDEDDEFVYDVYFRVGNSENATSSAVDSLAGLKRIGALSGFSDDAEALLQDDDDDSASDIEDEADEDSNAEDDYRNDYPEDEESDRSEAFSQGGDGSSYQ